MTQITALGHMNTPEAWGELPRPPFSISYCIRVKPIDEDEREGAVLSRVGTMQCHVIDSPGHRDTFDLIRNYAFRTGDPKAAHFLW